MGITVCCPLSLQSLVAIMVKPHIVAHLMRESIVSHTKILCESIGAFHEFVGDLCHSTKWNVGRTT